MIAIIFATAEREFEQALNLKTIFGIKLKRAPGAQPDPGGARRAHRPVALVPGGDPVRQEVPKAEKILQLSQALHIGYDELISTKLDQEFDGLQRFLNSPGCATSPSRCSVCRPGPHEAAHALADRGGGAAADPRDVAQQYNIGVEHFLHAALRSYQELTHNYYEDMEPRRRSSAAPRARRRGGHRGGPARLAEERGVGDRRHHPARPPGAEEPSAPCCACAPAAAAGQPADQRVQQAFVLLREAGYKVLGLTARALTTPPDRDDSFEQVLNDFKASYFAGAVLLPRQACLPTSGLLPPATFQPRALLAMLDRYAVTPETLMYRISQLLPRHFSLRPHFLRFNDDGSDLRLVGGKLDLVHDHRLASQLRRRRPASVQAARPLSA